MPTKKVISLEERVPKLKHEKKKRANRALITYVLLLFIVIISIVYLQSPYSKVKVITITGNTHVGEDTIRELSAISEQTNFWAVNKQKIVNKVKMHVQIKNAAVVKKFPNEIIIKVTEFNRIAYLTDSAGVYLPILENGQVLDEKNVTLPPMDAPILVGWKEADIIQEFSTELELLPEAIRNAISEVHYTPDQTDLSLITLYMNDGREISATIHQFAKKMSSYPAIVAELDPNIKGIIHLEVGAFFKEYEQQEQSDVADETEGAVNDESEG
ncbi:FtsQ-type POTRA domain-containing protein [Bacillus sp. HMF5848]|uniref:cell division protein FtsQ/DivIB n=1 Tax=Bacillus sp. HMF5848 TaxID=2495421 RepID=UPI000F7A0615|nr:FtsQ-type POTRA domain-containing protein [Bacillus sp. HMF5848]RSK26943.1 FtsQ-type POTRA domain-containing protein [Bacillus sp. HMF5848]